MFRFEEPAYLYLLLLLPLLAAFYLYSNYRKRKAIRKFGIAIEVSYNSINFVHNHLLYYYINRLISKPIAIPI